MNSCFKGKFRVTSPYGMRDGSMHNGIDLVGIDDITVYAPCDGSIMSSTIITDKNNITWQWGNYVCIRSDDGKYGIYLCHLASRCVEVGQRVKKGDKVGIMGNTGYSFGAHTHFEVRLYGTSTKVDPAEYIGIPNKVGVYDASLSENLEILQKNGVVNTPSYWEDMAKSVKYLDELIANMAKALSDKK